MFQGEKFARNNIDSHINRLQFINFKTKLTAILPMIECELERALKY